MLTRTLFYQIVIRLFGMNHEVADHLAVKTAFVLQALGWRALAQIVITRKRGCAGKMLITNPHAIVLLQIPLCSRQPCGLAVTSRFFGVIYGQYNQTQKARL